MASARRWTETARSLAKSAWPRPRAATVNCRRRRFTVACWTASPISAAASLRTTPLSWSLLFPRQTAHRRRRGHEVRRLAAAERGVRQAVRYRYAQLAASGGSKLVNRGGGHIELEQMGSADPP